MEIGELLLTAISPVLARMLLLRWIGDSDLAEEITASLREIISNISSDLRTQRKTERLFIDIAEEISESLFTLFEFEGASLNSDRQQIVVWAVEDTLPRISMDTVLTTLLLKHDLQAQSLSKELLQRYPHNQELDPQEQMIYERFVHEACQRTVEVVAGLPSFEPQLLGELLRRSRRIEDSAVETLNKIRDLYRNSFSLRKDESLKKRRFEYEYRQAVAWELNKLELFGMKLSKVTSRRHPLTVAYVSLQLRPASLPSEFNDYQDTKSTSVPAALTNAVRVIIQGNAGSGKTTMLKWIAISAAENDFPPEMADWANTIPFFIRLRDFSTVDQPLPSPEIWPNLLAPHLTDIMPQGWVHNTLKSGKAVILVDSLDEISEVRRQQILDWIDMLTHTFTDSRFVLSSRPSAVDNDTFMFFDKSFTTFDIEEMSMQAVCIFVKNWYKSVADAEGNLPKRTENLMEMAENLTEQIRANKDLRKLATNPLLCAMLCALHREHEQEIPHNRLSLYKTCLTTLIETRDIQRQIDLIDYPTLRQKQAYILLQDLAYWMFRNNYNASAPKDLAISRIDYRLRQMIGVRDISGQDIMPLLIERTNLIREPVFGTIDFTHRSFQEYLAAEAIVIEGDVRSVSDRMTDDQWREVIILTAGLAAKADLAWMLEELLMKAKTTTDGRKIHLLALECLSTGPILSERAIQAIKKHLELASPPKGVNDYTEIILYSHAQELALPYLVFKNGFSEEEAAACIRTLSIIGGQQAFDTIVDITNKASSISWLLASAIEDGWNQWNDSEQYTYQIVQPSINRFHKLALPSSGHFNFIHDRVDLTNLKGFSIHNCHDVEDWDSVFSRLSTVPSLEAVHLFNCPTLISMRPFTKISTLKTIVLDGCPKITHLEPLPLLQHLVDIVLYSFPNLTDLQILAQMDSLRYVSLSDFINLTNFDPLAGLYNLRILRLINCPHLKDLGFLSQLTKLNNVIILDCPQVEDFSPLSSLPNLKYLKIDSNVQLPTTLNPLTKISHTNR